MSFIPALVSTQPPIQWVPGALSPGVKLTTHLQLVPRSRKRGCIHPLPYTPSWSSACLVKYRDNFTSLHLPRGEGRPSPLCMLAITGPFVTALDDRWVWSILVEWELARETKVLGDNLTQCQYVYHKTQSIWPGIEPGQPKPVINGLSYGTATLNGQNACALILRCCLFNDDFQLHCL
jgi:hypothetical protein